MNEMKCKECYIDISDLEFSEGERESLYGRMFLRESILSPLIAENVLKIMSKVY